MPFIDANYINMARKIECLHHEQNVSHLKEQITHLQKALAWEKTLHQSRLAELRQVEKLDAQLAKSSIKKDRTPPRKSDVSPLPKSVEHLPHTKKHSGPAMRVHSRQIA
jgi:hypothetical protein